jgi:uncharacterized membrane protein
MIKIIKFILVLSILVCPVMATSIDIYYPNNNTTTSIYYSTGNNCNHTMANNISGELTCVILKDEIEYDNIIESPHKAVKPVFRIILFVVLLCIAIVIIVNLKRIFK